MIRLVCAVATLGALAFGCSSRSPDANQGTKVEVLAAPPPEPAAPSSPPTVAPAPAAANRRDELPADFPPDCVTYAELIDKLKSCDKVRGARDGLVLAYTNLRSAWSTVPPERREETAAMCRAQGDSLRDAAAAACGW